MMNVTFRGATKELEEAMLARGRGSAGMSGLRGHRSVGGLRASIYNAFPEDGVQRLVELLDEVERVGPRAVARGARGRSEPQSRHRAGGAVGRLERAACRAGRDGACGGGGGAASVDRPVWLAAAGEHVPAEARAAHSSASNARAAARSSRRNSGAGAEQGRLGPR